MKQNKNEVSNGYGNDNSFQNFKANYEPKINFLSSFDMKQICVSSCTLIILVVMLLAFIRPATAGISAYAEFERTLAPATIEILKKHGLPVAHNRECPWFYQSCIPGSYTLKFHQADEIPQQAILDIIKMCMNYYEQRGRKELFRIVIYRESHKKWRESLFLGIGVLTTMKPYFELIIGRK